MAQSARGYGESAGRAKRFVQQAWEWARQVYQEFSAEHGSLTAAAIALFGILSIFPLVLLAISGAAYALGSQEEALRRISGVLGQVLVGDASATLVDVLDGVIQARGIAGFLGLLGFLWAASRVFTILVEAFDIIWDVEETRGFLKVNLMAVGLVFLSLLFGVVMFLAPLAIGLLARYSNRVTSGLSVPIDVSGAWPLLISLAAYAAAVGLFYLLYKYVPNREVPWRSALVGAVTAGTVWELVRYLFQIYLVNFAYYNEIYGALAGAIILILWLYYSAMILLLGAVTAAVHATRVYGEREERPQRRGYDERSRRAA